MRRCPVQARKVAGFTLIEAAIVLVVIGLILGVVLQGQSLIRNAEYRSLKSDISDYQSAFYAFRDRYNRLPGDMPQSEVQARILDNLPGPTGSNAGNGIINDGPVCGGDNQESCMAWQHLRGAGLIRGDPFRAGEDASPSHPFGGVLSSFFTDAVTGQSFGHKMLITRLPGDIAQRLDDDIDGQGPDLGRVTCFTVSGGSGSTCSEYPGQEDTTGVVLGL